VISDTHGYLDPVVLERFAGVAHIIHAGDIVDPEIVAALEGVAPVTAVADNLVDIEWSGRMAASARSRT
jgi:predicted phosphodiesterase